MSIHAAFRRQPVPGEMAMRHQPTTLPAPIRGIVETENWAYTKPGSATVLDNWFPTQKGLKLRGGTERWALLPDPVEIVRSGFDYVSGATHRMFAATATRLFDITFADNPVLQTGVGTITNGNFSTSQLATADNVDWLLAVNDVGNAVRRFNGTAWTMLTVTTPAGWLNNTPYAIGARALDTADNTFWKCLVAHTSPSTGNFAAARATPAGLTEWAREMAPDNASWITGPPGSPVATGTGLTYVWKYRNRLFFIQGGTMNAWCLPVYAVGGELIYIPLSGSAKRGGSLLFGASWSVDSGDGSDDKNCFFTDQGEVLVFSGTDPTSATNWKQEGRFDISKPLGKNGHQQVGGDVIVITVDGIVPVSAAVQKDVAALSLAAITFNIEPMWMREFRTKDAHPWTMAKWDEGDALFVTWPGGHNYDTHTVGVSNLHTGAWCRYVGWDAMCFMQMRGSLFFGTQDGKIMQAESTGQDDWHWNEAAVPPGYEGRNYICTMVGGWEMFQTPPSQVTWLQARAAFFSSGREAFEPQLSATTDYEFRIPAPPNPGEGPELFDVWDQGVWGPTPTSHPPTPAEKLDYAQWDQQGALAPPVRNTMWVSIGETGFSHAPICQVNIRQEAKPNVELISISATYLRMGANV